jgi:hypothetical protein
MVLCDIIVAPYETVIAFTFALQNLSIQIKRTMPPRPTIPHRPLLLKFTDSLTGRPVSLSFRADRNLLSRAEFRAEFKRALELIKAEARFFAQRSPPGCKRRRQEALPPLGSISAQYSPCGRVRVMFRCVPFACQRLATAPGGMYVIFRTRWRWAQLMMEHVTRGRVKKVQVLLQRRASCVVLCAALGKPVLACAACLTRAAGNARWSSGMLLCMAATSSSALSLCS